MNSGTTRVAVFDLDETLTRHDTYRPFLLGYLRQHPRRVRHAARLPLQLAAVWRWPDRRWLKERWLVACMGGEPRESVQSWASDFARRLLARDMRRPGLERLRAHQHAGHRVVLASASIEPYAEAIGRRLGIDDVVATAVRWDAHGCLAGLEGANCRAAEKLSRVREHLGTVADGVE